jgi:pimeloyl-ACP methyl ester carboxylesterase
MPPARTVRPPGRGELFLRDTGGDGPAVMLLHGWIASADLNWWGAYGDLVAAGYRVLAIDHRGHGRGLRPLVPFTLADCAADAAAAIRQLGVAPVTAVGYSMGGAIAQLMARDCADVVAGLVLSGTAQHWQDSQSQRVFRAMGAFWLALSLAPSATWRTGLGRIGIRESRHAVWLQSELTRHSARDIAEAGRELARFDSRPWLGSLDVKAAVVVTTADDLVPASRQRELAAALEAPTFDADVRHLEIADLKDKYNPALLQALAAIGYS